MNKKSNRKRAFPLYFADGVNKQMLGWLAKQLVQQRGDKKTIKQIERETGVPERVIIGIEKGDFKLNLGKLRELIQLGYGFAFDDLLAKWYEENKTVFDPDQRRKFERDFHYSLSINGLEGREPTPFLVGGDPQRFLWAVPMRRLKGQKMVTDFLELAPSRKRMAGGKTPDNAHPGAEVIFVVYGRIEVCITDKGAEGPYSRRLKAGDGIHFNAHHLHRIENLENGSSALLFIVRLLE